MNKRNFENQKGFVALMSAILISAVLLVLAVPAARAAFLGRFSALARENKKISAARAEGCVQLALLNISRDAIDCGEYGVAKIKDMGSDTWEIIARANWKNSYTNLKVTVAKLDNGEFKITGWNEF